MILCRLKTKTASPLQKALESIISLHFESSHTLWGPEGPLGLSPAHPLTSCDITHTSALALTPLESSASYSSGLHSAERPSLTTAFSSLLSHYHISLLFSSKPLTLPEVFLFAFLLVFCAFPLG